MPHDLVTTRQEVIEKDTHGAHDMVVLTRHEAPSGPDGEVLHDPFQTYDEWVAHRMMELLLAIYPGHGWRCLHVTAWNAIKCRYDKIGLVALPVLMGVDNYVAINCQTHALTPGRVVRVGGEILERYGLRRGRFQLDPFLEAREKHSRLVNPNRKVPN